jgi:sugar lactone lactonase YvrE
MNGFEIVDPRFERLVLANAPLEKLADGFRWTEGPVWFGDLRLLLFSDLPNDRVMRWSERVVELRERAHARPASATPSVVAAWSPSGKL